MTIQAAAMFFGGFGIGFYYSWELTLVILALSPAMVITGAITGKGNVLFTDFQIFCLSFSGSNFYKMNFLKLRGLSSHSGSYLRFS